ncbi:MAG: SLC13 family permease [Nitrospiria bacterium]
MIRRVRKAALLIGPALGLVVPILINSPDHPKAPIMLGIAFWMAIWWMTECAPLAVTALLPLVVFPFTGIATAKETAPRYMTSTMFLFLGGFLIAQAMERTGLHRRIALLILSRWHASLLQIFMGFAGATAFLSMWISNTATTMLMATIAMAVITRLDRQLKTEEMAVITPALLLTVAYSANIGGMGTPVGTVPNLVFLETINTHAPEHAISFLQWMTLGVPVALAGLVVLYFLLGRPIRKMPWTASAAGSLKEEIHQMGSFRREERFVAWVLCLTALAWMTRKGIVSEGFTLPGWSALLPYKGVDDGTVAIAAALVLFLIPVRKEGPVLDREAFGRLPWGIMILFGGGFALAMGMQRSGLSESIGTQLAFLTHVSVPLMMFGIALGVTFLTEITSNTATTQVLLPILAAVALGSGHDMTLLLATATLSASCAFMLPVATPPNAIVFGTERIPMETMIKAGIKLNLVMPFVVVAIVLLIRPFLP